MKFKFKAPQIILLCVMCMQLGYVLANDGKPSPNYDFSNEIACFVFSLGLLAWGGFFYE